MALQKVESTGYPATVGHAFAKWYRDLEKAGFEWRTTVWDWSVWGQFLAIARQYNWLPARMAALEDRVEKARFRMLTPEQFDRELQAEVDARTLIFARQETEYRAKRVRREEPKKVRSRARVDGEDM